jgi:hypothetical protein
MSSLRDIRNQAREDLHALASVLAVYVASPTADPVAVNVRVHTVFAEAQAGPGAQQGLATMMDTVPKIRFLRSEISKPRARTGLVFLSATEGYRIHAIRPPYNLTIDAEVADLSEAELTELWDPSYEDLLV